MPNSFKRNAVFVVGLAVLFYWSFMFAKHDPGLREIIPFGSDPYDAVGSFGATVGLLIALVSLVRAFRPYRQHPPSAIQRVYLVRTQTAVVLAVFITLAADIIAMVRHPSMWIDARGRNTLLLVLGSLAIAAAAVEVLIRASLVRASKETATDGNNKGNDRRWISAVVTGLVAVFILLVYPENLINSTASHLLTVVFGAVLLFAPMRPLLTVLVPGGPSQAGTGVMSASARFLNARRRWSIVLLTGASIGGFLALAELSEGGGAVQLGQVLFVSSVFVGLAIAGLLIAYAMLGRPLGLAPE